jgi:hypothetical protein
MWTKLKIVEPIDYIQGDLIRENVAEEDGRVWTREYSVKVNSGSLLRAINVINRNIRGYSEYVIELLLEEDMGNIHAPPYTRALTNLDDKNCVIDFYYEDLEANVYYSHEDLVNIHHTDFNLNWSVVLEPNETIIVDATLPTRINYGRKLLWRQWPVEYKEIQKKFAALIETDSDKKEQEIVQELIRQGLNPTSPVVVKKDSQVKYTKTPPTIVLID